MKRRELLLNLGAGGLLVGSPALAFAVRKTLQSEQVESGDTVVTARQLVDWFVHHSSDGERHYKEACTWYGALQVAALLEDDQVLSALTSRYSPYAGNYEDLLAGEGHVDTNVWGIVPLQLYLAHGNERYRDDGLALADHQRRNIEAQTRWAIDDMFMITSLQVQAYRATGDAEYVDLAAGLMVRYLERLQQPDGTFLHHEDTPIRWCRGNGWVASGLTELLRELPSDHSDLPAVLAGYQQMMSGLLPYRIPSGEDGAGLWRQVLDNRDAANWPESSGSGMFTNAMLNGLNHGWLDRAHFGDVAMTAWNALVARLEPDGALRGVSNWMWKGEVSDYLVREQLTGDGHGQAPMLWSAATLLRVDQRSA